MCLHAYMKVGCVSVLCIHLCVSGGVCRYVRGGGKINK